MEISKKIKILGSFCALILILYILYVYEKNKQQVHQPIVETFFTPTSTTPIPSDWKTYKNTYGNGRGFSFRYPPIWNLSGNRGTTTLGVYQESFVNSKTNNDIQRSVFSIGMTYSTASSTQTPEEWYSVGISSTNTRSFMFKGDPAFFAESTNFDPIYQDYIFAHQGLVVDFSIVKALGDLDEKNRKITESHDGPQGQAYRDFLKNNPLFEKVVSSLTFY